MNEALRGLYAITDGAHADTAGLVVAADAAISGGARLIQYRDKSADTERRLDEARALRALCATRGIPLLINDDLDLAIAVDADGVHLGRDDAALAVARARLSPDALIGISCYDRFERAEMARDAGADYVAFGSFFPSPTKPNAVRATPALLRRAVRELHLPTVAIGGVSPENGASLVRAGADMLAVISALFSSADVAASARAFASCFTAAEETPT